MVALRIEADFPDFFEVNETGIQRRWDERRHDDDALTIRAAWQDVHKGVTIEDPGADIAPAGGICRGRHSSLVTQMGSLPAHGADTSGWPKSQFYTWETRTSNRLGGRSFHDLSALPIKDLVHPDRMVVATGAPWFMTVFGRDSL